MTAATASASASASAPGRKGARDGKARPKAPPQIVKTWLFDSIGPRKYAVQIKKAANGNPFMLIVEGVPSTNGDGTFRRFSVNLWSEDFARFFGVLDEVRAYMAANNIKTPEGHKYDPNKPRKFGAKQKAEARGR